MEEVGGDDSNIFSAILTEIYGLLHTEEMEQVLVWEDSDRIDPIHTLPMSSPVGRQ